MGTKLIVHKLDEKGREVLTYSGTLLHRTASTIRLEAHFEHKEVAVAGLILRRGDRFIETFYTDRWYNVFAVYGVEDGRLRGWYCNITRPARFEGGDIFAEDLALDLVVFPDGRWIVLDEEEFAALDLSTEERLEALRALTKLQSSARSRQDPFRDMAKGTGAPG